MKFVFILEVNGINKICVVSIQIKRCIVKINFKELLSKTL